MGWSQGWLEKREAIAPLLCKSFSSSRMAKGKSHNIESYLRKRKKSEGRREREKKKRKKERMKRISLSFLCVSFFFFNFFVTPIVLSSLIVNFFWFACECFSQPIKGFIILYLGVIIIVIFLSLTLLF